MSCGQLETIFLYPDEREVTWTGVQEVTGTNEVVRGAATATAPGIEAATRSALTANAAAAAAAGAAAPAVAAAKRVRLSGRS